MTSRRIATLAAAALLIGAASARAQAQEGPVVSSHVEALLDQMTLEEKLSFMHGHTDPDRIAGAGYLPGVPRLGVQPLRMADGPAGVRGLFTATAFPAPVSLASTFSTDLVETWGRAIGAETLARGQDVLLAPMTNIVRTPLAGRNFETFGEDPLVQAQLVSAAVTGIQSQGVLATIKHWAANNQETDRRTINANVTEETLREIEFPGFKAAADAGAGAFMCAYNRLNGAYACENPFTLTQVLRNEWSYTGLVMSDWGGTQSTIPSVEAGLDIEMPRPRYFAQPLAEAVATGEVSEDRIDESVRRILTQMDRIGLLTETPKTRPAFVSHERLAQTLAEAGAVLLKNDAVLPLEGAAVERVGIIGVTARRALFGGGGSAAVLPTRLDNVHDVLAERLGRAPDYAVGLNFDGVLVPASALRLTREGQAVAELDIQGDARLAPDAEAVWEGEIVAPEDGRYTLLLQFSLAGNFEIPAEARGNITLEVDGQVAFTGGRPYNGARLVKTADDLLNQGAELAMRAGEARRITIRAKAPTAGPLTLRMAWVTPAQRRETIAEAVALARRVETPLVFAHAEGIEAFDASDMHLPEHQDELISAVAAANPRAVVVLQTGAPVEMPWIDQVGAVLEMWYPGQEGGKATVNLLSGAVNPSGRLPVTFPVNLVQTPTSTPEQFPGVDGQQTYSEGTRVGYRWYDSEYLRPLFPFGHGLSYSRFEYSDLSVVPTALGIQLNVTVRNVGDREGQEVVQAYATPGPGDATAAPQVLVGFSRVSLTPGQQTKVTISAPMSALSNWTEEGWSSSTDREFRVGGSSRDIRLTARP